MTGHKPLHVRAAEALGWTLTASHDSGDYWTGLPPTDGSARYLYAADQWPRGRYEEKSRDAYVPHYDTDWSATGPLIERHLITLHAHREGWTAVDPSGDYAYQSCEKNTPLVAVCNLILALSEAGKLKEEA